MSAVGLTRGAEALSAFSHSFGAAAPEQAIVAACQHLRDRIKQARLPDSITGYLDAYGIMAEFAPIASDSRLDVRDGRYVILVRGEGSLAKSQFDVATASNRQRFSVAHELGHLLLIESLGTDTEKIRALADPDVWERVESLCDLAASALLIPLEQLIQHVRSYGIGVLSIISLASAAGVSREVVLRRFVSTGARASVLWRVRRVPSRREVVVSAAQVFTAGEGFPLRRWDPGRCVRPNIALRAAVATSRWSRSARALVSKGARVWPMSVIAAAESSSEVPPGILVDLLALEDRPPELRGEILRAHADLDSIVFSLFFDGDSNQDPLWLAAINGCKAASSARQESPEPNLAMHQSRYVL